MTVEVQRIVLCSEYPRLGERVEVVRREGIQDKAMKGPMHQGHGTFCELSDPDVGHLQYASAPKIEEGLGKDILHYFGGFCSLDYQMIRPPNS